MATSPIFTGTPKAVAKLVSAANTNRDGTGTIVDIWSGGSSGSRIERVKIIARGTTTAGVIRLYLHDGTTYFLIEEILVTAITPSTSIAVWSQDRSFADAGGCLIIPNGYKLAASTHNGENFNVQAFGGDF